MNWEIPDADADAGPDADAAPDAKRETGEPLITITITTSLLRAVLGAAKVPCRVRCASREIRLLIRRGTWFMDIFRGPGRK